MTGRLLNQVFALYCKVARADYFCLTAAGCDMNGTWLRSISMAMACIFFAQSCFIFGALMRSRLATMQSLVWLSHAAYVSGWPAPLTLNGPWVAAISFVSVAGNFQAKLPAIDSSVRSMSASGRKVVGHGAAG